MNHGPYLRRGSIRALTLDWIERMLWDTRFVIRTASQTTTNTTTTNNQLHNNLFQY
jgi:hypothetical protein